MPGSSASAARLFRLTSSSQPPEDVTIDTVVINGCECEPYLTTDHHIMAEYPERVHLGIRIMMKTLGVERAMIGIEKNKPDAIEAIRSTVPEDLDVTVHPLTVKYPQGAEKMLIRGARRPRGAFGQASHERGRRRAKRRLGGDDRARCSTRACRSSSASSPSAAAE